MPPNPPDPELLPAVLPEEPPDELPEELLPEVSVLQGTHIQIKGLIHRTDIHGAALRHTFDQCPVFYGGLFINDFRIRTTKDADGTSHYNDHADTTDTCGELAPFRPAFP